MKVKMIWVALLVAILAACGDGTSNGAVDSDDASTPNTETAVANDRPSPQPDVAPRDDAGTTTDAVTVADVPAVEDRQTVGPDSGMMVMVTLSNATCTRFRDACWRIPGGKTCASIICEMVPGIGARLLMPSNISTVLGYSRAQCAAVSSCRLYTFSGTPSDCMLENLSPEMMSFRCTCPGRPSVTVEADN